MWRVTLWAGEEGKEKNINSINYVDKTGNVKDYAEQCASLSVVLKQPAAALLPPLHSNWRVPWLWQPVWCSFVISLFPSVPQEHRDVNHFVNNEWLLMNGCVLTHTLSISQCIDSQYWYIYTLVHSALTAISCFYYESVVCICWPKYKKRPLLHYVSPM